MDNLLLIFASALLWFLFYLLGLISSSRRYARRRRGERVTLGNVPNASTVRPKRDRQQAYSEIAEGFANMATGGAFAASRTGRGDNK